MPRKTFDQRTVFGNNIIAAENSNISVGDLIITNTSSKDLETFIKQFNKNITHRDFKTAKTYIKSINSLNSLDDECKCLIKLLEYKLNMFEGVNSEIDEDIFLSILRNQQQSTFINDVVESIYIHHLSVKSKQEARLRYLDSRYRGSFTEEIFYEIIANQDDLINRINNGINDIYEHENCAFIRCAIRCEDFQLAFELSEALNKRYANQNSEILLSLSLAYRIHKKINGRHFWLIDRDLMEDLGNRINDCVSLSKRNDDPRVVNIATILLTATRYQSADLIDICSKNIDEAEKISPCARDYLLPKKREDINPNELIAQGGFILEERDISSLFTAYFEGHVTERNIKKWLDNGGCFSVKDNLVNEFIEITLKTITLDYKNGKEKLELSEKIEEFIKKNNDKIHNINIQTIHQICIHLVTKDLPLYVVQFLESLIPNKPWSSPIIDIYAEALLASDQIEKLDTLIEIMEGTPESYRFLAVKIERESLSNNLSKAIELTNNALTLYHNSCYYWAILLRLLYRSDSDESDIKSYISKIPKNILKEFSEDGLVLLNLIANKDLPLAESLILEWFIDDPVGMAIHVTNLHLNNLGHDDISPLKSHLSDRCSLAVVYTSGKLEYTKLLVNNCALNEYLIDTYSPLGQLLSELDVGQEAMSGMITYKVVEKLPPIVGAFRISMNIRNDINSGDDCFYQFSIEGEGIEEILEIINTASKNQNILDPSINGKVIPLQFRLNRTHNNNLLPGAFSYLYDKESNKYFSLFSGGNIIEENVVLDLLSLAYLSITGFSHGLINTGIKLFITEETYRIIDSWLKMVSRDDYLSIAKTDFGFTRTTSFDIARDENINNLRTLFDTCELLYPASIDMPEELTKIKDLIDISHYSSLKVAISNSIPFLCIDSMLCDLYSHLGVTLANAYQLMIDANSASDIEEIRHAICHVNLGLPVPIRYLDIINFCSQEEIGQYVAAQLLRQYSHNFTSPEFALQILKSCCQKSICSAYFEAQGDISLSTWRYTEHILYSCCSSAITSLKGDSQEQKIAILISEVLQPFLSIGNITIFAIEIFKNFIKGHFLDIEKIDIETRKYLMKKTSDN